MIIEVWLFVLFAADHHLEHVPHLLGNLFEHVEFTGALEPFASVDGDDLPVDKC